ncbi:hypothetical protein Tco_0268187 [Tanacetum coccineum]
MASLDRHLNPLYAIKECSSYGNLYTKDCGCSKGSLKDKILVPVPDLSQRPLKIEKICLNCGDPVHGLYCRQCALIRKTLEEVFQDFQDTSKSSDDDTNFVNQEPFVTISSVNDVLVNLVGKVLIMVIIVHRKFRLSLNRNHATIKPFNEFHRLLQSVQPNTSVPEHLDTIPVTESDEVIKSSVENLVPIPNESEGIPDSVCDVPLCNNPTPLEAFKEHSEDFIDSR